MNLIVSFSPGATLAITILGFIVISGLVLLACKHYKGSERRVVTFLAILPGLAIITIGMYGAAKPIPVLTERKDLYSVASRSDPLGLAPDNIFCHRKDAENKAINVKVNRPGDDWEPKVYPTTIKVNRLTGHALYNTYRIKGDPCDNTGLLSTRR